MPWIKIEHELPDKPEVWQIADELSIDPDAVAGKLLRVWSWFDAHTKDGGAPIATKALLDRLAGVTNFCAAMVKVGWLGEDSQGEQVYMANFEHHNGETAKERAQKNRRVTKSRAKNDAEKPVKRSCSAGGATNALQKALPEKEKEKEKEYKKKNIKKEILEKSNPEKNQQENAPDSETEHRITLAQAEQIYAAYPRQVGKRKAIAAIIEAVGDCVAAGEIGDIAGRVLTATEKYAASPAGQPPAPGKTDFRPHPASWFADGRYDDDPGDWQSQGNASNHSPPEGGWTPKPLLSAIKKSEIATATLAEFDPEKNKDTLIAFDGSEKYNSSGITRAGKVILKSEDIKKYKFER